MADPLKSSDIIRERMGFGVSPLAAPETRRAYAVAGLSPLGSQERQRFAEGRGISPMAGTAEKEAWKMAEYMAGTRPQAPVEYGGIGERPSVTASATFNQRGEPTGSFRRQIRMQEAWDAQQKQMIDQQRALQQLDLEQRQFALNERNISLEERREARLQAAQAKLQDEEYKTSEDADRAINEVLGGIDDMGNKIAGLDPDAPDYMTKRNDIVKRYPRAVKDEAFKFALQATDKSYFDNINFNQQIRAQEESSGRLIERQVAAEERAAEKQKEIRKEERAAQKEDVLVSQERELDKQIRAQRQVLVGLQGQKPTTTVQRGITESSNKLLDLEIEKAALRGLVFENQDEYKKAIDEGKKPPAGTTIYIGRKPTKVK